MLNRILSTFSLYVRSLWSKLQLLHIKHNMHNLRHKLQFIRNCLRFKRQQFNSQKLKHHYASTGIVQYDFLLPLLSYEDGKKLYASMI